MSYVVVSMTTIPARNGTLGPTIASLCTQTRSPDEIRVYAPPDCDEVPAKFSVHWIGGIVDYGPVTKLSAIRDLALPDDAIVVTCDDDQIYGPGWLETLVAAAERYPDEAVGFSGWNVRGFLLGFAGRDYYEWVRPPNPCDVLEGFAGVAYRRHFFDDARETRGGVNGPALPDQRGREGPLIVNDVFNVPESCRRVDDVWISGYLHKRGVGRRVVGHKLNRPAPSDRTGLHTRDDFVALNRAAARLLFG
jgi:hypothetical protein